MQRKIANLLSRYPAVTDEPRAAWERHLRRVAAGLAERLAGSPPRRAHYVGGGMRYWLPALLERAGAPAGKHFVECANPLEARELETLLAAPIAARAVLLLRPTGGTPGLTAYPRGRLDLAAILWPGDAPGLLDRALAAARAALGPGRSVAVCCSVDGSPEAPLFFLRRILRDLDPRFDLPPGSLPRDEEDLRERIDAAGFGGVRVWREGLSLRFADGASGVRHFLAMGGEALLQAPEVARVREPVLARLATDLEEAFGEGGAVVVTFEAALGIGVTPPAESGSEA